MNDNDSDPLNLEPYGLAWRETETLEMVTVTKSGVCKITKPKMQKSYKKLLTKSN